MRNHEAEPRYVISIAARLVGVQVHTLRYYEKAGFIKPTRSQGNIRLYSERDVNTLRQMKNLMDDLGINLAGTEVLMRMAQKVRDLQERIQDLEEEIRLLREG
jgi:MerR family transcriptional regulator/heat shock protein HspR